MNAPKLRSDLIEFEKQKKGGDRIKVTEALLDFIRKRTKEKCTRADIARELGINPVTVTNLMSRNDIEPYSIKKVLVPKKGVPIVQREARGRSKRAVVITPEVKAYIKSNARKGRGLTHTADDLGVYYKVIRDLFIEAKKEVEIEREEARKARQKANARPQNPKIYRVQGNAPKSVIGFSKPKKTAKNEGITARQIEAGRSFARGMQKPD